MIGRGAALLLLVTVAAPAAAGGRRPVAARSPDGAWRAGAAVDPAGGPLPAPDALRHAYDFAELPRAGETVTIHGLRMCIGTEPCTQVTWQALTLGRLPGGGRLAEDFGLPPGTRVFVGTGPNPRVAISLIARAGGRLLAVMPLCEAPAGSACRNGYQPWEPAAR